MNNSDDAAFLHTFSILLLGLTAVGIFAFILASMVSDNAKSKQPTETIVLERTKPVGKINTGNETITISSVQSASPIKIDGADMSPSIDQKAVKRSMPITPAEAKTGKEVYDNACSLCHMAGVAGAPRYSDKVAWEPRLKKSKDALYKNAINGYVGSAGVMPAKGGRPDLSNSEVKKAVDYLVSAITN